jgi:RND family efflux transporter MFP subunit
LALVGWRLSQQNAEARAQSKQQEARKSAPLLVQTAQATRRDIIQTYEAVGTVEAPVAVAVTPRISGRVTFIGVREGDRVAEGQVLARLDTAELQSLIAQREATLAQANARYAQGRATAGSTNVGVEAEIRRQQAALQTAQAQLARVRADKTARLASANALVRQAETRIASAEAQISSARATIRTAQASLTNARTANERQQALVKEGAVAQQLADNSQTIVQVQEGVLGEANETLRTAQAVRAGMVSEREAALEGVKIAQNQVRVDEQTAMEAVNTARASLSAARANRAQTPAYQANLQALQAAVVAAQADVQTARTQLGYAVLRSPITGTVTDRNLDPGALASPSTPIVSLQSEGRVWVNVGVPVDVAGKLRVGQTAPVTVDNAPQSTGRISRIFPAADPQSRQLTVRVALPGAGGGIRPGEFARVRFTTQTVRNALVVPREAVKRSAAPTEQAGQGEEQAQIKAVQSRVAVVEGEAAKLCPVQTGAEDTNGIQILSGLSEGESVIILSGRDVRDGQKVRTGGEGKGEERQAESSGGRAANANTGNNAPISKETAK